MAMTTTFLFCMSATYKQNKSVLHNHTKANVMRSVERVPQINRATVLKCNVTVAVTKKSA